MFPPSLELSKSKPSSRSAAGVTMEMPKRVAHGGTAWASSSEISEVKLYQPQDGALTRNRVADITSHLYKMAGEPEDARLTGGTRSLMRRVSGLNVGMAAVRKAVVTAPLPPQTVATKLQLMKVIVA